MDKVDLWFAWRPVKLWPFGPYVWLRTVWKRIQWNGEVIYQRTWGKGYD
jgi:hypothetical protein